MTGCGCALRLRLPDFVMLRAGVEMREYRARFRRDDRLLVIIAGEFSNSVERIEFHDRDKLDFVADLASKQLDALESPNTPVVDAYKDFLS